MTVGLNCVMISLFGIYMIVNMSRLFRLRFRSLVDIVKLACSAWRKRRNLKVKSLIDQRRVRRAAHMLHYGAHLCAVWIAYRTWKERRYIFTNSGNYHNQLYHLTDSEFIPMISLSIVCVLFQVRPARCSWTLDALTCVFSVVWAFQYYLMSTNLGGKLMELYLFNESWMVMLLTCINLSIGRVAVAVPCTIGVTIVDVYCKYSLAALHNQYDYVTRFYLLKQIMVCTLACTLQICFESLSYNEVEATLDGRQARMFEQLATRLTVSVYDAVAHLDNHLQFSQPAPKLESILLRSQLGVFQTSFLHLVLPEDYSRLKQYLDLVASADVNEPLMPIRVRLLDATSSIVRAHIFASAYRDDDDDQHYVLGIGEIEDVLHVTDDLGTMPESKRLPERISSSIPEDKLVFSDSDADTASEPSSVSGSDVEHSPCTFDVSLCQMTGDVVWFEASFGTFMRVEIANIYLPSLFYDSSAVSAWLKMQTELLRTEEPLCPRALTSGTFVILRGRKRFDASIVVRGLVALDDGSSVLELTVRLLKAHKEKVRKRSLNPVIRSREQSIGSADIVVTLRSSGDDVSEVIDSLQQSAELAYKQLLAERWIRFQEFWNVILADTTSSSDVSMSRSQAGMHFSLECHPDDQFVAVLSLGIYKHTACYKRFCRAFSNARAKKKLPSSFRL
eukprot:TRINITY_DN20637_c0_g1_i1.p1 TRINITY_DN20637_c0_g1~~TRINITY_DN20637_c0_g1_i1.p1  ORF type:complete len:675 (+),score=35.25 TRINITY_DN20637_c0_g1_i1:753-2777(+)